MVSFGWLEILWEFFFFLFIASCRGLKTGIFDTFLYQTLVSFKLYISQSTQFKNSKGKIRELLLKLGKFSKIQDLSHEISMKI